MLNDEFELLNLDSVNSIGKRLKSKCWWDINYNTIDSVTLGDRWLIFLWYQKCVVNQK